MLVRIRHTDHRMIGELRRTRMDKGRHPKVVRTWITDKLRKAVPKLKPAVAHKPEPHNKT
jgi:hypothetical protein